MPIPVQLPDGSCSCWQLVQEHLKKSDGELDFTFDLSGHCYLPIRTKRKDGSRSRKPVQTVVASYCPFCGCKLKKAKGDTTSVRSPSA